VNFLVDNQLPPALARFIQSKLECSAIHVVDVGMRDASDAEVWRYASKTQSILITKDEDFANMVLQLPTAKLIWVRVGNCRKTFLLDLFQRMWPRILQRLESGDRVIELR
jgi:predicted nuclease of predicted toxin-antitoxin system